MPVPFALSPLRWPRSPTEGAQNVKGRTGLSAIQSAPCPSVRLDLAFFLEFVSRPFVTSVCVSGAPAGLPV